MKLAAALLALLLLAPAAAAAPKTPSKLRVTAKSETTVLVTWRNRSPKARAIRHVLRFTVDQTQQAYVHPATHYASSATDPNLPPMGLRLRLRASFAIGGYSREVQVILTALKRYGMFVADNGSSWFITGATDSRWNDEALEDLKTIPGSAFEVVASGPLHKP